MRPRDRFAAETLARAAGVCDICSTRHGNRHGPLIACQNGIALCRECQHREGIRPLGEKAAAKAMPVLVGLQSRYYSADATAALQFEAEALSPLGTSTKVAGASGASGSGSNVVRNTDLVPTYQAILKSEIDATNAALTHVGSLRIWARVYRPTSNSGAVSVRLEMGAG
jgi:hypothetical protein